VTAKPESRESGASFPLQGPGIIPPGTKGAVGLVIWAPPGFILHGGKKRGAELQAPKARGVRRQRCRKGEVWEGGVPLSNGGLPRKFFDF